MILRGDGLAFGYGREVIGTIERFTLAAGETIALLGPNGGGKTTLLRTLLGLLAPIRGELTLDGEPLAGLGRRELAKALAYVPQSHTGLFPYTALDTVLMGRTAHLPLFRSPGRADREIAMAALAQLGIAGLAEREITRLSGGQRQLVLIARALAQGSRLLVMDEPTASLDFGNAVRVMEEVLRLRERGLGILLSTHAPDQALAVADRVLVLHGGAVAMEGPPEAVLSVDLLRRVYGVDVEIVRSERTGHAVAVPGYRYGRNGSRGPLDARVER